MIHMQSDSDATSMGSSPIKPMYYVQSPSRDSHEEDKSSTSASVNATRATTPMGLRSPSDALSLLSLFSRHSRMSLASRVSGSQGFRRKPRRERETGRLLGRLEEEEEKDVEKDVYVNWWKDEDGEELSTSCQVLRCLLILGFVFFVGCFVVWCISRSFVAQIHLENMEVWNFYTGEGADTRGVPTKMLTVNSTVNIRVHNTATFFGIHVRCSTINLRYYDLTIASGQLERYYQPRKSVRNKAVNIQGSSIPLYGAGASFVLSENGVGVPLTLEFVMWTQGNVVGKLVKSKHRRFITCFLNINSNTQIANFRGDSCA